jgi:hypothetical protein
VEEPQPVDLGKGLPDPAPLLPRWDLLVWANGLREIGRALIPCNWLSMMENSVAPPTSNRRHLPARRCRCEAVNLERAIVRE